MKKTIIIFSYNAFAHDIEVKKFEQLEKDQTAATSPRKGINGNNIVRLIPKFLK